MCRGDSHILFRAALNGNLLMCGVLPAVPSEQKRLRPCFRLRVAGAFHVFGAECLRGAPEQGSVDSASLVSCFERRKW